MEGCSSGWWMRGTHNICLLLQNVLAAPSCLCYILLTVHALLARVLACHHVLSPASLLNGPCERFPPMTEKKEEKLTISPSRRTRREGSELNGGHKRKEADREARYVCRQTRSYKTRREEQGSESFVTIQIVQRSNLENDVDSISIRIFFFSGHIISYKAMNAPCWSI